MRRVQVVSGLVFILALTGCSGGRSAAVAQDPIPTETPTVTPSPTPTVPADEHTLNGSEKFVRTYILETNRAYATGDVTFLRDRSAKECGTCASIIKSVAEVYSNGGKFVGAEQSIHEIQSLSAALQVSQQVAVILSSGDSQILSAKGKVLENLKAEPKSTLIVSLKWTRKAWSVSAIQVPS